jgi:alkaline phosphatase
MMLLVSVLFWLFVHGSADWSADKDPHKWNRLAKESIDQMLNRKINKNIAKNVILFLGDGMGMGTITAGRIRKGQHKGEK